MCILIIINSLTPKSAKDQNSSKNSNFFVFFILQNIEKQTAPCKSVAEEVSFEWSHYRISLRDEKLELHYMSPLLTLGVKWLINWEK